MSNDSSIMRHYVTYHNTDIMGYPCDQTNVRPLSIVTDKSVSNLLGNKLWLISGEGRPRKYFLCSVFVVDDVGADTDSGYKHYAAGASGAALRPPLQLNKNTWFPEFERSQQNFRFGLSEIKDPRYIAELESLASIPSESPPLERVLRTGAGFGDPETNRRVEESAVAFVTESYKKRGWKVESVESEKTRGYDLHCKKTRTVECVEVKGVQGDLPSFVITAAEARQAANNPSFVLCVVTSALSKDPQLLRWNGKQLVKEFDLEPLAYRATLRK
jgi:Domain of unknown function (DUF3883)